MPVCDNLVTSLPERSTAYKTADELFVFLRNLISLTPEKISEKAAKLVEFYKNDLENSLFVSSHNLEKLSKNIFKSDQKPKKKPRTNFTLRAKCTNY